MTVEWTLRAQVWEWSEDDGEESERPAGTVELRGVRSGVLPSRKEDIRISAELLDAICAAVDLRPYGEETDRLKVDETLHELSNTGLCHVVVVQLRGLKPGPTFPQRSKMFVSEHFALVRTR
ncbi:MULTISPECIES: hypothetical protein [unclassified Microbacterium]|uniref:hypothetical protein n=1 Tax=unclassified Microbacterium TaxID=2609290 RepID=UPI003C2B67FF